MQATVVDAIRVEAAVVLEGRVVLTTTCHDYQHFTTLPDVVDYQGRKCVKTGWSSDTGYACYQESPHYAKVIR